MSAFVFIALMSRKTYCGWKVCVSEHSRWALVLQMWFSALCWTQSSASNQNLSQLQSLSPGPGNHFLHFPDYWFNPINPTGWLLGRLERPARAFCFHIRFHNIFYGLPYRPSTGRKGAWRSAALAGRLYSWNKQEIRSAGCRVGCHHRSTHETGSVHELTSVREKRREPTPDACAANNRCIWMNFTNV